MKSDLKQYFDDRNGVISTKHIVWFWLGVCLFVVLSIITK
jgi:hypothetical protein